MQVQLSWEDPVTGEEWQPVLNLPVVLGSKLENMPTTHEGQAVAQVLLMSKTISRFHAMITFVDDHLTITDRSKNGTYLNGQRFNQSSKLFNSRDVLKIGPYTITVTLLSEAESKFTQTVSSESTIFDPSRLAEGRSILAASKKQPDSRIFFAPETDLLEYRSNRKQDKAFQLPNIFGASHVVIEEVRHIVSSNHYEEKDYVALGGGMGSFVWVDTLRICGAKAEQIRVIGRGNPEPYHRYRLICRNSQIPEEYERIRSGSDSCPDNIWGWPGYAIREASRNFFSGNIIPAFKCLWQVFAEPVLNTDTYTPIAGNVFASMDREAKRIGWQSMWRAGDIKMIRQTDDSRYVIVYSPPEAREHEYHVLVAKYIHLSIGYPSVKFLPDLLDYREKTGDRKSVVNAYEKHEYIYQQLKERGGIVLVRGRGIVASRVIQRLNEARRQNRNRQVTVIHLMRTPTPQGAKFGPAQRHVDNHWEFQPYNWPKATWGGDMRKMLETASPPERYQLLQDWGGTTTADRRDWRHLIERGLKEGWYQQTFGQVERVERNEQGKLVVSIASSLSNNPINTNIPAADFIIDATGLEADPSESPLLKDLISHYQLKLNPFGRLHVANDFEIKDMRNEKKPSHGRGRMYAAGIMTLGGPYAPVDTFLGLQYTAQRSAESLARINAPGISYLEGIGSLWQWIRWAMNQKP